MFIVKIYNLNDILLIYEVSLGPRQYPSVPHLINAKAQVFATMHSHENDVIVPIKKCLLRRVVCNFLLRSRGFKLEYFVEILEHKVARVVEHEEYRSSILVVKVMVDLFLRFHVYHFTLREL